MPDALPLRFEDDGKTVRVFVATDVRLHRRQANNPASLTRHLLKSAQSGREGRAYTNDVQVSANGKKIQAFFPFSEKDAAMLDSYREQGRKIAFLLPEGTPLFVDNE